MRHLWHTGRQSRSSGRCAVRAALLLALLLAVLLAAAGCATRKEMAGHSEYRLAVVYDSVFIDCTDTVFIEKNGDTVRIMEKKTVTVHKTRIQRDTVAVRDTVFRSVAVAGGAGGEKKRFSYFTVGFSAAIFLFFLIFALFLILKK